MAHSDLCQTACTWKNQMAGPTIKFLTYPILDIPLLRDMLGTRDFFPQGQQVSDDGADVLAWSGVAAYSFA